MKKYILIDIEDEKSNDWVKDSTEQEAFEIIQEWNTEMGTNYSSIEEFNRGEQYWRWKKVKSNI